MKKPIIIIGMILLVLVGGFFLFKEKLGLALPLGAVQVDSDSTIEPLFACPYELCEGRCKFICDVSTTRQRVICRMKEFINQDDMKLNGWVDFDYDDDGAIERHMSLGSTSGLSGSCRFWDEIYCDFGDVGGNWRIGFHNTRIVLKKCGADDYGVHYQFQEGGTSISDEPQRFCNPSDGELCDRPLMYACTYGAYVTSDPNWADEGVNWKTKLEVSDEIESYYTDWKDFARNDQFGCEPETEDGIPLDKDKSTIYWKGYSLACKEQCDDSEKYCKPKEYWCTESEARSICGRYNVDNENQGGVGLDICGNGGYYVDVYFCENGRTDPSYYQKCDGTTEIELGVYCNDWGNEVKCTSPKVCKPFLGSLGTEGIGECICETSSCDGHDTGWLKAATNPTQYYECITSGGCPVWSTTAKTCPNSAYLVFDEGEQDCVCDISYECPEAYYRRCASSSTLEECKIRTLNNLGGSITCTYWDSDSSPPTGKECQDDNQGNADWVCVNEPCDSVLQKQCVDNELTECVRLASGCLSLQSLGTKTRCCITQDDCDAGYECLNNNCEPITGFCNLDSECTFGQECIENKCQWPVTGEFCTQAEAATGETSCINNNRHICKSQIDGSYKWELLEECGIQMICVKESPAVCKPMYDYVGVLPPEGNEFEWGIGEDINGIVIDVTSNIGDNSDIEVETYLKDSSGAVLAQLPTATNNEGKAPIDFDYAHPKSEILTVEVYVGDCPEGDDCYFTSQDIEILKKLELKLNCPIQVYLGQKAECEFKTEDFETNALLTPDSTEKSVIQGSINLGYDTISSTKFSFTTHIMGAVNVKVTVTKSGYLPDTEELLVQPVSVERDFVFEVDNRNFFEYGTDGIKTGTKELVLEVMEAGQPISEVVQIQATMRSPTGQVTTLNFKPVGDGIYRTTYNFQEAGDTYVFKGTLMFTTVGKDNIPFEYMIPTTGEQPPEKKYTLIIIAVVVVFLIIIIALAVILSKK